MRKTIRFIEQFGIPDLKGAGDFHLGLNLEV